MSNKASGAVNPLTGRTVDVPPEYFLALPLTEENVQGVVSYHKVFEVCS